jgi:hypothetical protein
MQKGHARFVDAVADEQKREHGARCTAGTLDGCGGRGARVQRVGMFGHGVVYVVHWAR